MSKEEAEVMCREECQQGSALLRMPQPCVFPAGHDGRCACETHAPVTEFDVDAAQKLWDERRFVSAVALLPDALAEIRRLRELNTLLKGFVEENDQDVQRLLAQVQRVKDMCDFEDTNPSETSKVVGFRVVGVDDVFAALEELT
jgi:hypothetical protein